MGPCVTHQVQTSEKRDGQLMELESFLPLGRWLPRLKVDPQTLVFLGLKANTEVLRLMGTHVLTWGYQPPGSSAASPEPTPPTPQAVLPGAAVLSKGRLPGPVAGY